MPIEEGAEFFEAVRRSGGHLRPWWMSGSDMCGSGSRRRPCPAGEAQRVKLASELQKRSTGRTVYISDEPTTGLHFRGCAQAARGARSAGRPGQHGDRDRAQHGRHQDVGLAHRYGPEGGRGGGIVGRGGDARGDCGITRQPHRPVPEGAAIDRVGPAARPVRRIGGGRTNSPTGRAGNGTAAVQRTATKKAPVKKCAGHGYADKRRSGKESGGEEDGRVDPATADPRARARRQHPADRPIEQQPRGFSRNSAGVTLRLRGLGDLASW